MLINEQSSSLSFSIQEAVWLNRGKEIDELLSLALEPDIAIHESEDHVTVKGALKLFGEYTPKEDRSYEDGKEPDSLSEQIAFRSVEEVKLSEEGVGQISHSFPLDVTIPKERIHKLEDVYVTVDEFDYDLPGKGCIELNANVSVTGMKADEVQSEKQEVAPTPSTSTEDRSFHFEEVRQPEKEDNAVEAEPEVEEPEEDFEDYNVYDEDEEEQQEPVVHMSRHSKTVDESYDEVADKMNEDDEARSEYEEVEEEEVEAEESDAPDRDEEVEENALYLTKVLTQGENGGFAKLRMCIVQDGESLDEIASRYGISTSQLLRMNRLNEERVSEGQILYIPSGASSSKDS